MRLKPSGPVGHTPHAPKPMRRDGRVAIKWPNSHRLGRFRRTVALVASLPASGNSSLAMPLSSTHIVFTAILALRSRTEKGQVHVIRAVVVLVACILLHDSTHVALVINVEPGWFCSQAAKPLAKYSNVQPA